MFSALLQAIPILQPMSPTFAGTTLTLMAPHDRDRKCLYRDANEYTRSQLPRTYIIKVRIQTLEQLAKGGVASRFSDSIVYTLFGKNVVDYATKYCSMQALTISDLVT
jgi:hypothetical protein